MSLKYEPSSAGMFRQNAPRPKARGYFGVNATAYGYTGHIDMSALKVLPALPPRADTLRLTRPGLKVQSAPWGVRCGEWGARAKRK